jgi:hypothetical protein
MRYAVLTHLAAGLVAVPALAQCTPGPETFCLTIGPETVNNPNPGPSTFGEVFYLNGVESPEITLNRGQAYTFTCVNTPFVHPFYICTDPGGAGFGEWTAGVNHPGGIAGTQSLVFTVPAAAPDTLFYGCTFHFFMGWRINIVTPPPGCYANCDGSSTAPVLNVLDFNCFLNKFAAGDPYANCDSSTTSPVLNVLDFGCFLNKFAAGCR